MEIEHKQTEITVTSVDEDQGIVEAIWAVMGNRDSQGDIIHPGAFKKTFTERGNQVKLLDNHRTDSVMSALGTVQDLREVSRAELPPEILVKYPEATGGAWGQFKFLLDTPEGAGVFSRIKNKVIQSWSFGYDAIQRDHGSMESGGHKVGVRNLREIKLYEVSPVLFPANEGTATTGVKAGPSEGKPYVVVEEEGQYCVYRADSEGQPMGKPMGKHPTRGEAQAQVSALYANEKAMQKMMDSTEMGKMRRMMRMMEDMMGMMEDMMESPDKAGRVLSARNATRIKEAMDALHQCLMDAGLMEMPEEEDMKNGATGPQQSDEPPTSNVNEAGPAEDDSTRQIIELELQKLQLLEV